VIIWSACLPPHCCWLTESNKNHYHSTHWLFLVTIGVLMYGPNFLLTSFLKVRTLECALCWFFCFCSCSSTFLFTIGRIESKYECGWHFNIGSAGETLGVELGVNESWQLGLNCAVSLLSCQGWKSGLPSLLAQGDGEKLSDDKSGEFIKCGTSETGTIVCHHNLR